jgi:3-deoxy-D-manno-octulosonic-acid transferase
MTISYPVIAAYLLIQSLKTDKFSGTIRERLAFYGEKAAGKPAGRTIWIHAVSVGEAVGATPLIRKLLEETGARLIVSTATKGGLQILEKNFGESIVSVFCPLDFAWVVRRAMSAFRPDALIIMETELWPNLINASSRRGIPVLLFNGRVSDRMWSTARPIKKMYAWLFEKMSALGMQTERDAERIRELGAAAGKVRVLGNMKFDASPAGPDAEKLDELRGIIAPDRRPVFVAGSTHPGEDGLILSVYEKLLERDKSLRLVIAPRHIERAAEVQKTAGSRGYQTALRSSLTRETPAAAPVVVLDTIGELRCLYSIATVCFVGGSLVERGGHNVLEPAACGKAVFYGPYMMNFTESARILEEGGGGIRVKDAGELAARAGEYLSSVELRGRLDENALNVIRRNAGATERAYLLFREFFK